MLFRSPRRKRRSNTVAYDLARESAGVSGLGGNPEGNGTQRPIARLAAAVYTAILMPEAMIPASQQQAASSASVFLDEMDPLAPQREAAMFYGLFLRGHSPESLRKDIDVPRKLLDKLLKRHRNELAVQVKLQRAYYFRKQVLAIFDELVTRERIKERVH